MNSRASEEGAAGTASPVRDAEVTASSLAMEERNHDVARNGIKKLEAETDLQKRSSEDAQRKKAQHKPTD